MNKLNQNKELLKKIGRNVAKFRKKTLKMSQRQVAKEMGMSQSVVNAFEHGRNDSLTMFYYFIKKGFSDVYLLAYAEEGIAYEY